MVLRARFYMRNKHGHSELSCTFFRCLCFSVKFLLMGAALISRLSSRYSPESDENLQDLHFPWFQIVQWAVEHLPSGRGVRTWNIDLVRGRDRSWQKNQNRILETKVPRILNLKLSKLETSTLSGKARKLATIRLKIYQQ